MNFESLIKNRIPSTINDTKKSFTELKKVSDLLHDILEYTCDRHSIAIRKKYLYCAYSPAKFKSKNLIELIDYLSTLLTDVASPPEMIRSSSIFLLAQKNSPSNMHNKKHATRETKRITEFDGKYLRDKIEQIFGDIIKDFIGGNYNITDASLFEISKDINNGKNVNNKLHIDGGHKSTVKGILYLNTVKDENGPFSLVHNKKLLRFCGEGGTFILFRNTQVYHAASKISNGCRKVIIFEIIPSIEERYHPLYSKPLNAIQLINPMKEHIHFDI